MKRFWAGFLAFQLLAFLPPLASAAKYKAAPVKGGGALSGTVAFQGTPPPPAKYLITKDQKVCGKGQAVRREVDVRDGRLRGAVVYLERIKKGKPFPKKASKGVVDQRKCAFKPYLQVIRNKSKLTVLNSDPVLHNIHAYELIGTVRRSMFNIAQPKSKPRVVKKVRIRRSGAVRLECDAHNWMLGWLFVAKNPYYAVVGDDGGFTIGDIPPGSYTLTAWHPALGFRKKKVEVKANGKTSVSFTFSR